MKSGLFQQQSAAAELLQSPQQPPAPIPSVGCRCLPPRHPGSAAQSPTEQGPSKGCWVSC